MRRVKEIMALRRFAEAWTEVESGTPQEQLTKSPYMEQVLQVQIKRARGEIE